MSRKTIQSKAPESKQWQAVRAKRAWNRKTASKICPLRLAMRTPLSQLRDFAFYMKKRKTIPQKTRLKKKRKKENVTKIKRKKIDQAICFFSAHLHFYFAHFISFIPRLTFFFFFSLFFVHFFVLCFFRPVVFSLHFVW